MKRMMIVGALAAGLVAAGAGIALASGPQDDDGADRPITGPALEKAKVVALEHTGGGRVTETEVGDEEGYYEVEVTKDSRQFDVHLDKDFTVLGSVGDTEGDNEGDSDEGR
jgi:hypothetical protein